MVETGNLETEAVEVGGQQHVEMKGRVASVRGTGGVNTDHAGVGEPLIEYINQPFFNELRTNQQLGYVVYAFEYSLRNVYGLIFMV